MSSGTFSGSLSVTGTNASLFQISGGNLVLSGSTTTAGTYNINIVATQSGISNSPFTQNFPSIQATAASQESAEGFTVTTTGTTMFASTSAGFAQSTGPWNQFALVNTGTGRDPQISLNGTTQTDTGFVSELIYHNHTAYQENTSQGWWRWDTGTGAWIEFGVSTVSLSASTYSLNAPADTLIGTISVAMLDGSTFSGTLAVNDTAHFKIVGSQLKSAATLTASSYSLVITAVPAVSGTNKIGEQGTLNVTVAVPGTLSAPAQAANAGFRTLSFNDDFTNPGGQTTIATTKGAQSGFKWYWTFAAPDFLDPSAWSVNTTQQAASVPIVTSAGSNASPNGGILKLVGIRAAGYTGVVKNAYLATCPITNTVPTLGNGVWQHCYFEAYIALDPLALGSSHPSLEAFPAFWSWGAEALAGFGDSSTLNQTGTEIDFLEDTSGVDFGGGPDPIGKNVAHVVDPNGNGVYGIGTDYPTNDSEWHTYGCLWTNNNVKFYKDNVLRGPSGGVDTTGLPLESFHQFMVLGTGINWPIYVDWVRVWVA